MKQLKETSISNDSLEGEYFWSGKCLMRNDIVKFCSHHIMEIDTNVINPSEAFKEQLVNSLNNYNALKDENEKLKKELATMYSLNKEGWGKVEYYEKQADQFKEINKELIEALEELVTVHSQLHRNAHTYTEIRNAKAALQKAKQL